MLVLPFNINTFKPFLLPIVTFELTAEVDKSNYQLWTVSEEQNERLRIGREFIKAVEHLSDYTKVYPLDVSRGVSQLISYDIRSQKYFVNL